MTRPLSKAPSLLARRWVESRLGVRGDWRDPFGFDRAVEELTEIIIAGREPDAQLWESARLKAKQLETEIRGSAATKGQQSDMLHTLSKLTMFAGDAARRPL